MGTLKIFYDNTSHTEHHGVSTELFGHMIRMFKKKSILVLNAQNNTGIVDFSKVSYVTYDPKQTMGDL